MYDGCASGVDLYSYVEGDPISLVDPDGQLPSLPQVAVDAITGAADAMSWGVGPAAREFFDVSGGVNPQSGAYQAGYWGAAAAGGARAAYAAAAKAIKYVPNMTWQRAVDARNTAKRWARGGTFPNFRRYTHDEIWRKYNGDARAIVDAASRTSPFWNAVGFDAFFDAIFGCLF